MDSPLQWQWKNFASRKLGPQKSCSRKGVASTHRSAPDRIDVDDDWCGAVLDSILEFLRIHLRVRARMTAVKIWATPEERCSPAKRKVGRWLTCRTNFIDTDCCIAAARRTVREPPATENASHGAASSASARANRDAMIISSVRSTISGADPRFLASCYVRVILKHQPSHLGTLPPLG